MLLLFLGLPWLIGTFIGIFHIATFRAGKSLLNGNLYDLDFGGEVAPRLICFHTHLCFELV